MPPILAASSRETLKLPRRHRPAREAAAQASVVEKLPRVFWSTATIEVGWSGGGGEMLNAGTDQQSDHVLLQPLVVADAGVAARRQNIDEVFLGNYLQADLRISGRNGGTIAGSKSPSAGCGHETALALSSYVSFRTSSPPMTSVAYQRAGCY
jgi:hypothetical protein